MKASDPLWPRQRVPAGAAAAVIMPVWATVTVTKSHGHLVLYRHFWAVIKMSGSERVPQHELPLGKGICEILQGSEELEFWYIFSYWSELHLYIQFTVTLKSFFTHHVGVFALIRVNPVYASTFESSVLL